MMKVGIQYGMIEGFFHYLQSIFSLTLFTVGDVSVSFLTILKFSVSAILVIVVTRTTKYLLEERILAKFNLDTGSRASISILASYLIGGFGFLIVLQTVGLDFSSITVIIGGLGVGIGFGLQDITKNFISGITILLERKLNIGDIVEFEEIQGRIQEISLRTTTIRTFLGENIIIPNGILLENKLTNRTSDKEGSYISIDIRVDAENNPLFVTEILLESAHIDSSISQKRPPQVFFNGYDDGLFEFQLAVWVENINDFKKVKSSLNYTVEYNLRKAEIQLPDDNERKIVLVDDLLNGKTEESQISLDGQNTKLYIRDYLQKVEYFQNFNELELRKLIEYGYRQEFAPAEILFREGDPGNAFYVILSGSVEVFIEKLDKTLVTLKAGDFLGELSLLLGIPRTASVRILEKTTLFIINSQGFKQIIKEQPKLQEEIIRQLSTHQEELQQRQAELRKMGLVDDEEDDRNPVSWVRNRLNNLFGTQAEEEQKNLYSQIAVKQSLKKV
ncbi:mechanosensitive ion channel domain-containing protein [Spirulina sp. 06S082]|uniref:mechanosensitive ion channel domain-containing protein n=1 Tax=Spirulina sp. 06S082 TaxID=3110248 RepID=UPI002B1FEA63|nr:mechanosensitive ion channel domain-containing protein [Spirulina sp. 06S082]MEA5468613.1 mechanosensitive ion channel domain-containing protein [Spirulina sp. 06S082]